MGRVKGHYLDQLPSHERRRLLALGSNDPEHLARLRCEGTPLQYLEGFAPFTDFDVVVDERVLVPRPETEGLFELAVTLSQSPSVIVDLGTGSGVLAIALARRFPAASVHAVDISADALEVARENTNRLGVGVALYLGDLFEPLPGDLLGGVDLVVSNPPYVSTPEWAGLPEDVRREPQIALVAGPVGDEVLRRIASEVGPWLAPGGVVVCEVGETQADGLKHAMAPLGQVLVHHDLAGRPRYLSVEAPT